MGLTPLEVRKVEFRRTLRGLDPDSVEQFLAVVADELADLLARSERLGEENRRLVDRLGAAEQRERDLQETLLRAQRVSDEILANAQREAQLMVREAEFTADKIVQQAIDHAQSYERRIAELKMRRDELRTKLRHTLDHFVRVIEAEAEGDEDKRASIHRLPRPDRASPGSS